MLGAASTGIPADRFVPGVGPVTLMSGEGADVTPLGQGALALSFGLVRNPLHLELQSGALLSRPVRWQFSTDLAAEAGLWRNRLAFSVGLPVVWWQAGGRLRATGIDEGRPAEARGALRLALGPVVVDAGAGAGLDGEVAAPAWRVFLLARALVGRAR